MQNQNYKEAIKSDIFSIITKASEILEVKSYVIGGYVRDYILQRGAAKDIDIVTGDLVMQQIIDHTNTIAKKLNTWKIKERRV